MRFLADEQLFERRYVLSDEIGAVLLELGPASVAPEHGYRRQTILPCALDVVQTVADHDRSALVERMILKRPRDHLVLFRPSAVELAAERRVEVFRQPKALEYLLR